MFVGNAIATLTFAGIVAVKIPETRPAVASPSAALNPVREMLEGLAETFRDRHFAAFLALQTALLLVFIQIQVALPLDMAAKGIGPATFGALVSINGLLIAVLQPLAGPWLAGRERGRVLAMAALVIGAGFGMHAFAHAPSGFAVAIAVWTIGEIGNFPVASALVAELAPVHLRGRYQGAYAMTLSVAAFVAPLVGPALLERLGNSAFWAACFAVGAATAGGHLHAAGPRRRHLASLRAAELQ